MTIECELPGKCRDCAKSSKPVIHAKCDFCRDLDFQEEILCHLNRCVQDPSDFTCHAFQPVLRPVGEFAVETPTSPEGLQEGRSQSRLRELLDSDKIKYARALASQKLSRDPDGVFVELKYHLAWNVMRRKPVFAQRGNVFDFIGDTFSSYSVLVGGFVALLWLAPDHLHLYVDSDGENSIETIAQEMKRLSSATILAEFPDLKTSLGAGKKLWDKAYFVETIG